MLPSEKSRRRDIGAILPALIGLLACTPSASPKEVPLETRAPAPAKPSQELSAGGTEASRETAPTPKVAIEVPPEEPPAPPEVRGSYAWKDSIDAHETVAARIPTPKGFERVPVSAGTFAEWLRTLPVKPGSPPVHLYNGELKGNQSAQELVLDIDTGSRNLQQCADAVMRLRAEYLYSREEFTSIHFNFTTGDRASYTKWREGFRPKIQGNRVSWLQTARATTGYESFRAYLESVFTYAGTASLALEMKTKDLSELAPGDVFIRGGFPGHAVIVVDVAQSTESGRTVFLLAQSYMPAQEMHVLRNPSDASLSPWYSTEFGEELVTPEWTFSRQELKQFR